MTATDWIAVSLVIIAAIQIYKFADTEGYQLWKLFKALRGKS